MAFLISSGMPSDRASPFPDPRGSIPSITPECDQLAGNLVHRSVPAPRDNDAVSVHGSPGQFPGVSWMIRIYDGRFKQVRIKVIMQPGP